MLSSCNSHGDNIGGFSQPQVSVSFKESETTPPLTVDDYADMTIIFDALVRVMAEDKLTYRPDDPAFVSRVMSAVFSSYSGALESGVVVGTADVSVPVPLASDYLTALFGSHAASDMGVKIVNNAYVFDYVKPSDAQTKVTDFLADEDGTCTAYVDYIKDGTIESRYIITLAENSDSDPQTKYHFGYTVTAAITFE